VGWVHALDPRFFHGSTPLTSPSAQLHRACFPFAPLSLMPLVASNHTAACMARLASPVNGFVCVCAFPHQVGDWIERPTHRSSFLRRPNPGAFSAGPSASRPPDFAERQSVVEAIEAAAICLGKDGYATHIQDMGMLGASSCTPGIFSPLG
jgi:hypothetical protein